MYIFNIPPEKHNLNVTDRKLVTFTTDPEVCLNGREPIYRNGSQLVGYLNRGSFGYTINRGLGTGYVHNVEGGRADAKYVMGAKYEVDVMGERFEAVPHLKPLYVGDMK